MDRETLLGLPVAEQVAWWRQAIEADPRLGEDPAVVAALEGLDQVLEANPLQGFGPHRCRACGRYEDVGCAEHRTPQLDFLRARTAIIAAFAGNQFGKTTSLVVRAGLESLPVELVPKHLQEFKTVPGPTFGWILCPTEEKIFDSLLPAFREWMPAAGYLGGVFDKGWNGSRLMLTFANGSTINFKTYKQHPSTLGGARLHWVGYDEPPPREHRDEAMTRLLRYGGYEMFAMTPLKTNTGWIRRDIWKNRENPEITVVKASMHDNLTLHEERKQHILSQYESDVWRQAREMGDFVDVGGLIYADFEQRVVAVPPPGDVVRALDPVVAIDPGIRNAAFIFGGFDSDNTLTVFDELLLQDATPEDYATGIQGVLNRWGIRKDNVTFVIDPAARSRAQVNAESVESALARLGIFCVHGQNAVEAGIQQVRSRIQHRRIHISPECRGLRDEADEYAAEDRADGEFRVIKQNDHRLDALRYLAMYRPFDAVAEAQAVQPKLGWTPGHALPASALRLPAASPPLGSMS